MLLKAYRKEIFRPECNPGFQSLHCIASLGEDIGDALPYLNAVLGGDAYTEDPPSVTFKVHGKLITVHSRKIAINALGDEEEADKILAWLQREINAAWEDRKAIEPSVTAIKKPQILEILKRLPRTNCRECGLATCMVFAVQLADGIKGAEDCPVLDSERRARLQGYLREANPRG